MRSALTLAALASAAMALPVHPSVANTKTENALHSRHYGSHHGQHHGHHKYHHDYVKADIAHALCETVNGLADLVRSSNIGDKRIPDGFIDCSRIPRSNKGKICSSDHDHSHGHGQHHGHHGSHSDPQHDQHHGSHHHHDSGHDHGHHGHEHGHGHQHGGDDTDGNPNGTHGPDGGLSNQPSSTFSPLLSLNLGDDGLIDSLVGNKGVLRPVLSSLANPLDELVGDTGVLRPVLGSLTNSGDLSPDALKQAAESPISPANGLPLDTFDPTGNLIHAVNGNSAPGSDILGTVTGATGELLHVGVTGANSPITDGVSSVPNIGGVPLHIGTLANPVLGADDAPVAGLIDAATTLRLGSAPNPAESVNNVNALPVDNLTNGVDAPFGDATSINGVPTGTGELIHAETHDGNMLTSGVTHDLAPADGASLTNGALSTNGGLTAPVGELLHADVHNDNESTGPTVNNGNLLTGNIPIASGNELVDDATVPLIHAQTQAQGTGQSSSNQGPVINGANGRQVLQATSENLAGSGNASRAGSELLHAGVDNTNGDGPVINGLGAAL
ncbi:hypothetical protein BKA62DRAFT_673982 [Auriculariales sp. MPI-PUGE-AT-0066]|nr:hypothetical protein BKA62DRAFT_673982 [Auriculariales sp. MPI-PUGE-AT-0066]